MKNTLFVDTVDMSISKIKQFNEHSLQYSDKMRHEQKELFKKQVCACIDSL